MAVQLVLALVCIYIILSIIYKRIKKPRQQPPDFSGGYPVIGHVWKLLGDRKHGLDIIQSMSREALNNGGAVTLRIGPYELYTGVSDPDDCLKIANECLGKDDYYSFAKPFLGNGLTVAEVPIWKRHRKMMSPAFRQTNLNSFLIIFNRQAKRLLNEFKLHLGRGPFTIDKCIGLNSLESICMTSFGADVSDFDGIHQQYLKAVNEILDIFTERFQKFWLHNDIVYNWSGLKTRQDRCVERIMTFSKAILAKRKADMKNECSSNETGTFNPFMAFLLEISKETGNYSEEDILYETNTIVGGGYDTSTVTITLVLMLLGSYQEVQKKVYEELQEVFVNSNRDVEKEDLHKLNYLDAVIKETLRLYPIAPLVARRIERDIQIKNYTLKAGNGVALLYWGMHRHPVWGADAEVFRPERWLDGSLPEHLVFGGFSLGKRDCIGKTYAMMSLKTVVSHVVRSYKISADITKLRLEMHVVLRATAGQIISIEERI